MKFRTAAVIAVISAGQAACASAYLAWNINRNASAIADARTDQTASAISDIWRKKKSSEHCYVISLYAWIRDIRDNAKETPEGTTYWFPVYDSYTREEVGTFTESSIVSSKDGFSCITYGLFNLDYDCETETFHSQIKVGSSCKSEHSSIIGGNGEYACAAGQQTYPPSMNASVVETELYFCDTCNVRKKKRRKAKQKKLYGSGCCCQPGSR